MGDLQKILIQPETSILEAIKVIDLAAMKIALVVDENDKLIGTVSDGDIRRGILRGISLEQPVRLVLNERPYTLEKGQSREIALETMRRLAIYQLPVLDQTKRVVGIELFDEPAAFQDAGTWVVIMAGGLGIRLRPITENVPKPMIPVGGSPLLETIIRNFETQGFRQIYLAVNYMSEVIRSHFGDGQKFGVAIEYLLEGRRLGTAGALSLLPRRPTGPFIVMNGDLLTLVNFRQLIDFHHNQRALATMCVRKYAFQVPHGVVRTDGLRLNGIIEKPVHTFFVNAGIYVIEPDALDILPSGEPFDMPQLFDRITASGANAAVFPMHEYWIDIGRFDDLERAEGDIGKVFER